MGDCPRQDQQGAEREPFPVHTFRCRCLPAFWFSTNTEDEGFGLAPAALVIQKTFYKLIKLLTKKWFPVVLGAACRDAAGVGCFLGG